MQNKILKRNSENWVKNKAYKLVFKEDTLIAWERKLYIIFSSLVHIELIKSFHVEKKVC